MRSRRRIAFRMTAFCDPWAGRRPWAAVARIRRIFATAPAALPAGPRPATGGRSSTRQGIARRCRDRAEAARGVSRRHPLRTAARRGGATEPRRSPVLSPRPGGPRAGSPGLLREPARRLARRRPAAPCVRDDRRAVHGRRARRRSGACRGCRPDPPPGRASRGRAPRGKGRADGRHVLSVRLRPGRGERPPTLSPRQGDAAHVAELFGPRPERAGLVVTQELHAERRSHHLPVDSQVSSEPGDPHHPPRGIRDRQGLRTAMHGIRARPCRTEAPQTGRDTVRTSQTHPGPGRLRLRGPYGVEDEFTLAATARNLR